MGCKLTMFIRSRFRQPPLTHSFGGVWLQRTYKPCLASTSVQALVALFANKVETYFNVDDVSRFFERCTAPSLSKPFAFFSSNRRPLHRHG